MPRKNNKTPEVRLLLRENQRRARARQKDLIEDMRQRLRAYETDGIQASINMQTAARAVAAENRYLRVLLAQNGVTSEAVNEFLARNGVKTATIPSAEAHIETRQPPRQIPLQAPEPSDNSTISPSACSRDTSPGTHMDCDVAASIVADVHGHGDHDLARTTLGCTTRSCSVKTTQVFSIIDSAT